MNLYIIFLSLRALVFPWVVFTPYLSLLNYRYTFFGGWCSRVCYRLKSIDPGRGLCFLQSLLSHWRQDSEYRSVQLLCKLSFPFPGVLEVNDVSFLYTFEELVIFHCNASVRQFTVLKVVSIPWLFPVHYWYTRCFPLLLCFFIPFRRRVLCILLW